MGPILSDWQFWVIGITYFIGFGGFLAMGSFIPTFMTSFHGCDLKIALYLNSIYLTVSAVSRSSLASFTDKYGGDKCTLLGLVGVIIGSVIFAL